MATLNNAGGTQYTVLNNFIYPNGTRNMATYFNNPNNAVRNNTTFPQY